MENRKSTTCMAAFMLLWVLTVITTGETRPIPEFNLITSRTPEFDLTHESSPLYNSQGDVVGALQGFQVEDEFYVHVHMAGRRSFHLPDISSFIVPLHGQSLVAYGEVFRDPIIEGEKANLHLYSFEGTLLRVVETHINSPFWVAVIGHAGDFWVAGSAGPMMSDPYVFRRYAPSGDLLWEQRLSAPPALLVLSPENTAAMLALHRDGQEQTPLILYNQDGEMVGETLAPAFLADVVFTSEQTILFHTRGRWGQYDTRDLETPLLSGEFHGNLLPLGPFFMIRLLPNDCLLVKTYVHEETTQGYMLQAIQRTTGDVLAEHLFDEQVTQDVEFYRVTSQNSFEILLNRTTIVEFQIP